jgi:hypothetical protein
MRGSQVLAAPVQELAGGQVSVQKIAVFLYVLRETKGMLA